jgi:hypothetical protein
LYELKYTYWGSVWDCKLPFDGFKIVFTGCVTPNIALLPSTYNYAIGSASVSWSYPTFTVSAQCAANPSYEILIDGNIT